MARIDNICWMFLLKKVKREESVLYTLDRAKVCKAEIRHP